MIKKIEIENYKSLENLSMELGRFNVLIGENGCGKTNILESLVFAAAGVNGKINSSAAIKTGSNLLIEESGKTENNFLTIRGGRTTEAKSFRSGFDEQKTYEAINIQIIDDDSTINIKFENDNRPFSKWSFTTSVDANALTSSVNKHESELIANGDINAEERIERISSFEQQIALEFLTFGFQKLIELSPLYNYIIYAPENFFLRNINISDTFAEPIGYRGEGLLNLIKIIKKEKPEEYNEIISHLDLIDWFDNFEVNEDFNADSEFTLSDKYLEDGLKSFDIRNANEGFLFVLFYLTIFISDYTPKFFAIDNIDTALNPKLCSKLISVLAELAKKHDKQVIITTHNPSVLDGLNLNDDEERLFVIARNKSGRTRATRIEKKPAVNGTAPVKLSEQFLRGYIGGLPKNF